MNEVIKVLKDGYWDCTSVVRVEDGSLRVRKESRVTETPGPWAYEALRREIAFLCNLPNGTEAYFPPILQSWDEDGRIGYEVPYYENRRDLAALLLAGALTQEVASKLQERLATIIFDRLHRAPPLHRDSFAHHVVEVVEGAIEALGADDRYKQLIEDEEVTINGAPVPGLRRTHRLLTEQGIYRRLDWTQAVLLHGDLILENVLWSPLLLIDPVSVAALDSGPPLFDLVKYESYARGELYAIREELITIGMVGGGYTYAIDWKRDELRRFRELDLSSIMRSEFERVHGKVNECLYQLIDGYFSLVMARNTSGLHQWARVIKGCLCFQAALPGASASSVVAGNPR